MSSVFFRGGPFDGKSGQKPDRETVRVPAGNNGRAVELAVYKFDGTEYIYQTSDFVHMLVGGPLDGGTCMEHTALPEGDSLVIPHEGKYLWYKPAGEGRFQFDGVSDEKDLEPAEKPKEEK